MCQNEWMNDQKLGQRRSVKMCLKSFQTKITRYKYMFVPVGFHQEHLWLDFSPMVSSQIHFRYRMSHVEINNMLPSAAEKRLMSPNHKMYTEIHTEFKISFKYYIFIYIRLLKGHYKVSWKVWSFHFWLCGRPWMYKASLINGKNNRHDWKEVLHISTCITPDYH